MYSHQPRHSKCWTPCLDMKFYLSIQVSYDYYVIIIKYRQILYANALVSVRLSVRPSVRALTFERIKFFEIWFRKIVSETITEAKFEDGRCRSVPSGSKGQKTYFFDIETHQVGHCGEGGEEDSSKYVHTTTTTLLTILCYMHLTLFILSLLYNSESAVFLLTLGTRVLET